MVSTTVSMLVRLVLPVLTAMLVFSGPAFLDRFVASESAGVEQAAPSGQLTTATAVTQTLYLPVIGQSMAAHPRPNAMLGHSGSPGRLIRAWWTALPEASLAHLTEHPHYPDQPAGLDWVTSLETPPPS